ncbi:UbiH/UbiF family hydroxylase [Cereibacter changlensis JA139]|uniref:UbiH/UbiF family hydroxylase n=2 Tax=Cereibacter changlensis TaxID=402884 RepID=A0A2T4JP44_9RHOB|nr:UbiH/UbiF family hydroxylase [Cereibacter changlensis]PTE19623.1 UbiH/UbiF family hydroxylase [Cereibacter changlensis JA139]PZX53587.1 2-octaprenyl-6-methoxyphenol hydroxylase [Cereibacter changlensis]
MTRIRTDILISGGGVAGLTAAAGFASAGYDVICVDPAPPVISAEAEGADLRSTAFLQPSIPVLQAAGLWDRLAPHAAPLQVMRIIDAGGAVEEPRIVKDFDASDISDQPFGWNLPNWLLRREMVAHLATLPNVDFRPGTATRSVLTRESEAVISLTDGSRVSARLLIGADGRNSPVREALGIGARVMRYGQKALAFTVTHDVPHRNVSTEIHRSGGPFTLVPLPDRDGQPASAIVWMETGAEAQRLQALPAPAFEAAMDARSCGILGPLRLASRRTLWPIISQIAERMTGERTALMAEAAHVMPPIGAQGLNMSLADLAALLDLARPETLGEPAMLEAYHRRRHLEVQARIMGIDALNRASMLGDPVWRDLRATMLNAMYSLAPVRKTLMKAGLGVR